MTIIVGITGGIGSGKTTLSSYLKKKGYCVHESDKIVHEIYNKPKKNFINLIKKKTPPNSIKNGKINKKIITGIIFENKAFKKSIEKYIHKEVFESRKAFIKTNTKKNKKIIFADIPLLFENNLEKDFDIVLSILSTKKKRTERVIKNKKFSKKTLYKIFSFQVTDKERRAKSDIIINNNKTKKDFIFATEKALMQILK
tara:strand:- start:2245 stop:2841 length:597 start_codon:yes stop_codon:yes gene_type:complete